MMMENQLLVIVDDVPMSPVDARLPPTLASTATAVASDKPVEVPVIWDEVARRQVEDVPIPPVDTRVPPTSASSTTTTTADEPSEAPLAIVVVSEELARSQGEDVPMTFVRATFASAATAAYTVEDQPSETGESVCFQIGHALRLGMPPVQVWFSSTSASVASIGTTNKLITPLWMFPCRLLRTGFHPP